MKYTLLLLAVSCALPLPAFGAGLTFAVSPNAEFGPPGGNSDPTCQNGTLSCLIFSSIITPDDTNDAIFTDVQVVFNSPSPGLSLNDNFFLVLGPAFLNSCSQPACDPTDPANWFSGPTFEIDVDPSTALGVYNATATLIGGFDPDPANDTTVLGSDTFQIVIVPEPAFGWAACLAMALIALATRRRLKTSPRRR
jgi:hypothetical protein